MFYTRLDYLLNRAERANDLLVSEESSATPKKKKKSSGELFGAAAAGLTFRGTEGRRPSNLGIIHPSDGHPMQELSPDFNWFRPLSWNNPTWTLYWPELIV